MLKHRQKRRISLLLEKHLTAAPSPDVEWNWLERRPIAKSNTIILARRSELQSFARKRLGPGRKSEYDHRNTQERFAVLVGRLCCNTRQAPQHWRLLQTSSTAFGEKRFWIRTENRSHRPRLESAQYSCCFFLPDARFNLIGLW